MPAKCSVMGKKNDLYMKSFIAKQVTCTIHFGQFGIYLRFKLLKLKKIIRKFVILLIITSKMFL